MRIRIGYELLFEMPEPTAMLMLLYLHPDTAPALQRPEHILVEPQTPVEDFIDWFGNRAARILAPAGQMRISYDNVVENQWGARATDRRTPAEPCATASASVLAVPPREPVL